METEIAQVETIEKVGEEEDKELSQMQPDSDNMVSNHCFI